MGQRLGPFDIAALIAAADGTIVKKVGGVYVGVIDPAGPWIMQVKDDNNDAETLVLGTWTKIDASSDAFGMVLPQLAAGNDGEKLVLEFEIGSTLVNRFTLTPNAADIIAHGFNELGASEIVEYESGLPRLVQLTADFVHTGGPRWVSVESPAITERNKQFCTAATFDVLPFGTAVPAGTQIGKTLTGGGVGALTLDGVTLTTADTILVGGEQGAGGAGAAHNGIYNVTVVGDGGTAFVLTRRTDAHLNAYLFKGFEIAVAEGTQYAGTRWFLTGDPAQINIETTPWIWERVPAPMVFQGKDDADDGDTLVVGTWNRINTASAGFNLNLPKVTPGNDGQLLVLDFVVTESSPNRLTLTPDSADVLDFGIPELSAGVVTQYETTATRLVKLVADLNASAGPRWRITETPEIQARKKHRVILATFFPLPAVTAAGALVGKTLTADDNGPLFIDGLPVSTAMSVLIGGETDAVDNGIYNVTFEGDGSNPFILTRRTDTHLGSYLFFKGAEVYVAQGNDNSNTKWELDNELFLNLDVADLTWRRLPTPLVLQTKDFNDDGDTLRVSTYTKVDLDGAVFELKLPTLSVGNDGQSIFLELGFALGSDKRLTLTPAATDAIDHGNLDLPVGGSTQYESTYHRVVELIADFKHFIFPRWKVVEQPHVQAAVKQVAQLATFAPLADVVASGAQVGKSLTGAANGALSVDAIVAALGISVVVGGQQDALALVPTVVSDVPPDIDVTIVDNATWDDSYLIELNGVAQSPTPEVSSGGVGAIHNGIYKVEQTGDGSNPFILTRRTDAHLNAYVTAKGMEVELLNGVQWVFTSWKVLSGVGIDVDGWNWKPTNVLDSVSFSTIAADQDDYQPAGFARSRITQIDGGTANRIVTGLDASFESLIYKSSGIISGVFGLNGARTILMNVGTTNTIILKHDDNGANSLLRNKMMFPLGIDHVLGIGDSIELLYDHLSAFWRPL